MSDDALARRIEQRSLRFGIGANAVMTLAGFVAHVLTGSSALLLDGLYSAVLVGSSLIASRISRNVVRPPDRAWPYGYEGQEALYVLFRSLVLLGVIGFGLSSSCGTFIDWWRGAEIPPLTLEPVAAYTVAVMGLCWLLSWRHFRDWRRTGRISLLLLTEAQCPHRCADHILHRSGTAGDAVASDHASGSAGSDHRCAAGAGGEWGAAEGAAAGAAGCSEPGRR